MIFFSQFFRPAFIFRRNNYQQDIFKGIQIPKEDIKSNVGRSKSLSSSPPPLVSIICTDEVFSSQRCVSVSNPFRRAPAHALKGCDKEDESDVTFTALCLPTLLGWSACPFESSKSAARQIKLNQGFFPVYFVTK